MRFLKRSARADPEISLILLDWSVRESFHLLHYLAQQDVPRARFEVLVLEYYSRESDAIRRFADQVDTWALLEMPESCYYHKHLMYNAGIVLARGRICVVCDSDAIVTPAFIRTISDAFAREPALVLHLDQFRNNRRDLYPFNFPSIEAVLGPGCINNAGGRTAGVADEEDPIHTRNYGACMCALRSDLVEIGGADEHIDFAGHICGPYDMTFRLVNSGRRERWHQTEFMYHTWHPGQAGVDNYLGPHDGRHVSTTALAALTSGRVRPLRENPAIRRLREAPATPQEELLGCLIRPEAAEAWARDALERGAAPASIDEGDLHVGSYKGFAIYRDGKSFYAHLPLDPHRGRSAAHYRNYAEGDSRAALEAEIDRNTPRRVAIGLAIARLFVYGWQVPSTAVRVIYRALRGPRAVLALARQHLRAFVAHVGRRGIQFVAEGRQVSEALGDLVPNLQHVGPDTSVIVEGLRAATFLHLLRRLRIVPAVRLQRVYSMAQVMALFDDLERGPESARAVLTRALYWRCYAAAAGRPVANRLIVV